MGLIVCFGLTVVFGAQAKNPAGFDDYGKWESLVPAGDYGGFSPDGKWIVYAINRSNGENELCITEIAEGKANKQNVANLIISRHLCPFLG